MVNFISGQHLNNVIDTITINQDEYERLTLCYKKLSALEAGGVSQWEHYQESMDRYCVELKKLGLLDQILCNFY